MAILDNNCLKTHTCLVFHTKLSPIYISYENSNIIRVSEVYLTLQI